MECPCPCPQVKLVGCNLDSSIYYLSPKAKVKCRDLCRPSCERCRPSRATVIRPGDGDFYDLCGDDPRAAAEFGWIPPYNFGCNPHHHHQHLSCPGFNITRDCCEYPQRDYIEGNAVNAVREVPKIPHPRIVLDRFGEPLDWCKSGYARNHVFGKNYGVMPQYFCSVKERLALEDYKLRCVLAREGRVCKDPGHNIMNQLGLLEMLHTKNPLVFQSKFYLKPKIAVDLRQRGRCCQMPYPCFHPY